MPRSSMRRLHLLHVFSAAAATAAFALCGCDATGGPQGGQPLLADPCAATDGGHTWTDLYTCYFGPSGKASCSAQAACHGSYPQGSGSSLNGALTSGYVCGTTKQECWYGMTHAYDTCDAGGEEAGSPDAALDAAPASDAGDGGAGKMADGGDASATDAESDTDASCLAVFTPLVPAGGATDPTTTTLWSALQKASGGGRGNMPCVQVSQACPPQAAGYTFTADDLARISAWIKEGAQDN